ncbi:uncharacterized protein LOC130629208 [Hydractinia symbiolongicarpus]|uniref:uncharacterized protein LOC130629208 n=1 Tax=Hydractinia symbiolongicarpus TaxID=13093 RepID=UPI00254DADC4|nr:uncharacterized protein LOC130629208 [Hydractinia symbiolongicarpus]
MIQFRNLLSKLDWELVMQSEDANSAYQLFLKYFYTQYEKAFPKRRVTVKTKSLLSPWMTKGLIMSSRRSKDYMKSFKNLFEKLKKVSKFYSKSLEMTLKQLGILLSKLLPLGKNPIKQQAFCLLKRYDSRMEEYNLTMAELNTTFKSLQSNKSAGIDEISVNVTHLSTTLFFQNFKRIMHNRIYEYFVDNDMLYITQFGFQKGHSTDHAVSELVNKISESFDKNMFTLGVFIDLSKAFDTVNHKILLSKLQYDGVQESTSLWFKDYLTDRKQCIPHVNHTTEVKNVKCGVPQGSILERSFL